LRPRFRGQFGGKYKTQKSAGSTVAELDYYQGTAGTYAGFDRFGRIVDQKWKDAAATVIDRYQYGYDCDSNRLWRENVLTHSSTTNRFDEFYTYDGLNRLVNTDRGTLDDPPSAGILTKTFRQQWGLDQVGNWPTFKEGTGSAWTLEQTRTNNTVNEITGITGGDWIVPAYDARGNMTSGPKPNSPASAMTCVYDAWNRMVQAKNSDGSIIATYRYDGTGRRIRKLVGADPENPTATYDYYHNPAWQVLETRKNGSANPYEQFVWSLRYVHAPVLRWFDPDTAGQNVQTHYYCNDANFNVTALVGTDGAVVERYTYDPYGKVTFRASDWSERSSSALLERHPLHRPPPGHRDGALLRRLAVLPSDAGEVDSMGQGIQFRQPQPVPIRGGFAIGIH
jgi:hypothetical protein